MSCDCRCHAGGAHLACDRGPLQPGGFRSCTVTHDETVVAERSNLCEKCGAFGSMEHSWVEGSCILPHRTHSFRLLPGSFVCVPCVEQWGERLTEIVELYATLDAVLEPGSVPDTTATERKKTMAKQSPAPFRLDAWLMLHPEQMLDHVYNEKIYDTEERLVLTHVGMTGLPDIPALLAQCAEALWDHNGWIGYEEQLDAYGEIVAVPIKSWPDTVSGAAAAIKANIETIARMPDVDTFHAEHDWIHRSLRQAHGLVNPKPLGACLTVDCQGQVWPGRKHGDLPACDRCQRRYGSLDLARLTVSTEMAKPHRPNRLHSNSAGSGRA